MQVQRAEEDRLARLQYEFELRKKHNRIKRRNFEISLFETKAELSEPIEEYEEMRSTTCEQLRTVHVPTTHHLDQQEREDFQRP